MFSIPETKTQVRAFLGLTGYYRRFIPNYADVALPLTDWHNDFYANKGEFSDSAQGKHNRTYVLDDEDCCKKALSWLHEHAYHKGKPNMTAATFATWVNVELLPKSHLPPGFPTSITPRTARK